MLGLTLDPHPPVYHGAVTKTELAVGNLDDEDVCVEYVTERRRKQVITFLQRCRVQTNMRRESRAEETGDCNVRSIKR